MSNKNTTDDGGGLKQSAPKAVRDVDGSKQDDEESPRTLSPMSVEGRDIGSNLSGQKEVANLSRDSRGSGSQKRKARSPEREQRGISGTTKDTDPKRSTSFNTGAVLTTQADESLSRTLPKRRKMSQGEETFNSSLPNQDNSQNVPKRFQSFKSKGSNDNMENSSSGSYNDEQRDSISNLQEDTSSLIYKGTSFDQIFKQSFIKSHSRTANLKKNRRMSQGTSPTQDDPKNVLTSGGRSGSSSLQPSMNPGSYGNPARIAILEESKESSGDEFEQPKEHKRGLQLVSAYNQQNMAHQASSDQVRLNQAPGGQMMQGQLSNNYNQANAAAIGMPAQEDPNILIAMLFKSIEDRDMNLFVHNFNRLNHFQVHQLIGCVEGHGLTLIHQCAYFGQYQILQYLVENFRRSSMIILEDYNENNKRQPGTHFMTKDQMVQNVNLVLKRWVDSVTLNRARVTALHYATKLSSKLFVYLVDECGADVTIRDPHGMSVMHKAAFDDNSYLITYLRDKSGFDIMEKGRAGNTPLHYACDGKAAASIIWLLGFGADVNAKNDNAQTPMHLLMTSGDKLRDVKTLREMVFRGADKSAIDDQGRTPLEIFQAEDEARFQQYGMRTMSEEHLMKDVVKVLGKQPAALPCCQFRAPMQALEKSNSTFYLQLFINPFCLFLLIAFIFPFNASSSSGYVVMALFVLQAIAFVWVATKDPGYHNRSPNISFLKLNEYFDQAYICPTCEILRPKESFHCHICNRCVDRFDHHCLWINNCVGVNNHGTFLFYLISAWLYVVAVEFVMLTNFHLFISEAQIDEARNHWLLPIKFLSARLTYRLSVSFVFVIASLALLFLTYMLSIHVQNFMHGKTTSARIKATAEKSVNKHLGQTQFQVKIDNLTVKDYAKRAIKNGSEGQKIFDDFAKKNGSNNEDQEIVTGVQPLIEEEPGDFSDLDDDDGQLAPRGGLRQRSQSRVRGSRVTEDIEEAKQVEEKPTPKKEPSAVAASVINCLKFCQSRKQDQNIMLADQMEINIEYLQDNAGDAEHGIQSLVQL